MRNPDLLSVSWSGGTTPSLRRDNPLFHPAVAISEIPPPMPRLRRVNVRLRTQFTPYNKKYSNFGAFCPPPRRSLPVNPTDIVPLVQSDQLGSLPTVAA